MNSVSQVQRKAFAEDMEDALDELCRLAALPHCKQTIGEMIGLLKAMRIGAAAFEEHALKKAVEKMLGRVLNTTPSRRSILVRSIYDFADSCVQEKKIRLPIRSITWRGEGVLRLIRRPQ